MCGCVSLCLRGMRVLLVSGLHHAQAQREGEEGLVLLEERTADVLVSAQGGRTHATGGRRYSPLPHSESGRLMNRVVANTFL